MGKLNASQNNLTTSKRTTLKLEIDTFAKLIYNATSHVLMFSDQWCGNCCE